MYSSADIAAQISANNQAAMQQAAYASSITPMSFGAGTQTPGQYGEYSEQLAHGGIQRAMSGAALGMGALSVAGGMGMLGRAGHMLDPMSMAWSAGKMGMGAGRMMGMGAVGAGAMGALGAGAVGLGLYAGYKGVTAYTNAFSGGMQDQAALNSTLRSNFRHFGGNGQMGQGFSSREMGSIGGMMSSELRSNSMTSANELNSLIGMGAQSGQFTGVKDVQDFSKSFKKMLHTLKEVQKELGGSLADAMKFIDAAKQSGVFQQVDQLRYAAGIRTAEATSGLTRGELMGLSAQGAQIARGVGGLGRQGAMGALRGAAQLGAAVSAGVINEQSLSDMTGGLTGGDAIQAATMQLMQSNAAFTRRSRGRYTIFGLSNANGTGMDADAMDALMSGEMTTGQLARRAHGNVRTMGRARAVNQEGRLRGAFLEDGGLAGQLGLLRSRIGERIMDGGDERIQAYLTRSMRMSGDQAQVMTSLLRNQGTIASEQLSQSTGSARATAISQDAAQYQSLDAFQRELGHSLSNATGVTAAREAGRRFLTKLSSLTERALSDMLGGIGEGLNSRDARAVNNFATGNATITDMRRVGQMSRDVASGEGGRSLDINYRGGVLMDVAHGLSGHGGRRSIREVFQSRGLDATSMNQAQIYSEVSAMRLASNGIVTSDQDRASLASMQANSGATASAIQRARADSIAATGSAANYRSYMQGEVPSALALDAWRAGNGLRPDDTIGATQLMGQGASVMTGNNIMADLRRAGRGGVGVGAAIGAGIGGGLVGGLLGGAVGAAGEAASAWYRMSRGEVTGYQTLDGLVGRRDRAITRLGTHMTDLTRGQGLRRQMGDEAYNDRTALGTARFAWNAVTHAMSGAEEQDWSSGQMESLMQNEDVRSGMLALASGDETVSREAEERLLQLAGSGGVELGDHLSSFVRRFASTRGTSVGRELNSAITDAAGMSEEQIRAQSAEMARMSGLYSSGADVLRRSGNSQSLEELRGARGVAGAEGMTGVARARLAMLEMADGFTNGMGEGTEQERYLAVADGLAALTPEQRNDYMRSTAGDEQLSGMMRGMTMLGRRRSAQERDLSGRGWRGARRATEAAFGIATGGTFGEMGLSYTQNERTRRVRDATDFMRQIESGGEASVELMDQLREGMRSRGMKAEEADEVVGMMSGGIDADERRRLQEMDLQGGQRGAGQRSNEMRQRDQNPLDATRNDLLTEIRKALEGLRQDAGTQSNLTLTALGGVATEVRASRGPGTTEDE